MGNYRYKLSKMAKRKIVKKEHIITEEEQKQIDLLKDYYNGNKNFKYSNLVVLSSSYIKEDTKYQVHIERLVSQV